MGKLISFFTAMTIVSTAMARGTCILRAWNIGFNSVLNLNAYDQTMTLKPGLQGGAELLTDKNTGIRTSATVASAAVCLKMAQDAAANNNQAPEVNTDNYFGPYYSYLPITRGLIAEFSAPGQTVTSYIHK